MNSKAIERAVMDDKKRPCLYGVAPPCSHPKCLEAHYKTMEIILNVKQPEPLEVERIDGSKFVGEYQ